MLLLGCFLCPIYGYQFTPLRVILRPTPIPPNAGSGFSAKMGMFGELLVRSPMGDTASLEVWFRGQIPGASPH